MLLKFNMLLHMYMYVSKYDPINDMLLAVLIQGLSNKANLINQ